MYKRLLSSHGRVVVSLRLAEIWIVSTMGIKLFNPKSVSVSEMVHVGRMYSKPLLNFRHCGVKFSPQLCSCRGKRFLLHMMLCKISKSLYFSVTSMAIVQRLWLYFSSILVLSRCPVFEFLTWFRCEFGFHAWIKKKKLLEVQKLELYFSTGKLSSSELFFIIFYYCFSGAAPKVSFSNNIYLSKEAIDREDRVLEETCVYRINGANGLSPILSSTEMKVLKAIDDEYGGVVVDPESLPANPNSFAHVLRSSLSHWKTKVML